MRLVRMGFYEGNCNFCKPGEQEGVLVRTYPENHSKRQCVKHAGV